MRLDLWPDEASEHASELDRYFAGEWIAPNVVLVAEIDGALVGFAELGVRPYAEGCATSNVGYLEGWYVAPDQRESGVGRALVEAAESWAREQGCTEFASDTAPDNQTSRAAHLACGFDEAGVVICFSKRL